MGKSEGTLGGRFKPPKVPNERKSQAKAARDKGPITNVPDFDEKGEFGDYSYMSKDWRPVPTVIGRVEKQKREICWAIALARLLQAIYNINITDISLFLEFMYQDLVQHLMPKEAANKVASLELKNIKKAISHIASEGLLTVKSTGFNMAGGSGHHEKWQFHLEENAEQEFIREKLDVSPVVISFHVSDNGFSSVGKGIYKVKILEEEGGKKPSSHMVLIVRYGYTSDGKLFFLIQNSWGTVWGANGFARIFMDENSGATVVYP